MKNNLQEQIRKNINKVDKMMKELTTPKINVLDKSVEAIVKKYFVSINKGNLEEIHKGIVKQLNIKTIEDSQYFDKDKLIDLLANMKSEILKKEQSKLLEDMGE